MDKRLIWPLTLSIVLAFLLLAGFGCRSSTAPTALGPEAQHESEDANVDLSPVSLDAGEKLRAVATTSIVGDVVKNVGGDQIDLTVLMPPGVDPHSFEPTPKNLANVADAHVVFANGGGLEAFLTPLLESAEATEKAILVSDDVDLLESQGIDKPEGGDEQQHGGADPHTWTDPNNVIVWTRNIEHALSALDPANAQRYAANAASYEEALKELDGWVREQIGQIPGEQRQIVTDHVLFAYFANRYGFRQAGAIVPGYSTAAEPSVKELAELEDSIRDLKVRAIFVGNTVNPTLAERVADDTGTQLVFLYTGSLTEPGGDADTYIDYVKYNVVAIVDALR